MCLIQHYILIVVNVEFSLELDAENGSPQKARENKNYCLYASTVPTTTHCK